MSCKSVLIYLYGVMYCLSDQKKHASNQTLRCHAKMAQLVAKEPLEDNRSLSNLPWGFSFEYREGGREGGTGV